MVARRDICWGEGEHATLRSMPSSLHHSDKGYIHITSEQAEGADWMETGAVPFAPAVASRRFCRRLRVSHVVHRYGRPMWNSAHGHGPREDKRIMGRVCNSLYRNDCL
jgi:hypothetical protein